jgi:hypothetical protein
MGTAALIDAGGNVLKRKKSYGGRQYRPEMFTRLGRQAAIAVTASPVPAKIGKTATHVYQFVFFDVPDGMSRIEVSVEGLESAAAEPAEKGRPPVFSSKSEAAPDIVSEKQSIQPSALEKPSETKSYGGSSLQKKEATSGVNLIVGSGRVAFAGRPVIRSFLDEEILRLLQGTARAEGREHPAAESSAISLHSPEQARKILASTGLVPIWEYAHIGMSPDEVSRIFSPQVTGGEKVKFTVVDCASGICEYSLEGLEGAAEYRLYFQEKRLRSTVVALAMDGSKERTVLLERLKGLYGGRIWQRGAGSAMGQNVSNIEYVAELNGMRIETLGLTLRVFGSK